VIRRPVSVVAAAALCSPGPGRAVEGFDPVAAGVPRKHLKTMTRAVQLGVAAVAAVVRDYPGFSLVDPTRRGLYVGASPQSGDAEDLAPAIAATGPALDLTAFARHGVPLVPPLWLVKGLSNNVLGYASAQHDLRADNGNWCDGRLGGAVAVTAAVHAVAEGRVDLAIAGGVDALLGAEAILDAATGEAAGFLLLVAGRVGRWRAEAGLPTEAGAWDEAGEIGAAAVPVRLARAWRAGAVADAGGTRLFLDD
jgi:hypothetical protein